MAFIQTGFANTVPFGAAQQQPPAGLSIGALTALFSQGVGFTSAPNPAATAAAVSNLQNALVGIYQIASQLGAGWSGALGGSFVDPMTAQMQAQQAYQAQFWGAQLSNSANQMNTMMSVALGQLGLSAQVGVPIPGMPVPPSMFAPPGYGLPLFGGGPMPTPQPYPYGVPQPLPFPVYGGPQPVYGNPQPVYGNPQPVYGGPQPSYPGVVPFQPLYPTAPPVAPTTPDINTNIDFTKLSTSQRSSLGLSDRERAVLHLWGIQMATQGKQDGGIYINVLNNPSGFKPAEQQLVQELLAKDQSAFGGITGKALDQEFFGLFQKITGQNIAGKYGNTAVNFAQGPVDIANRDKNINGLSAFENGVLRLWGHEPLFNGGKIDGSILSYTLNSPNALDFGLNKSDVQALLSADLASDGVRNGDSLAGAFSDVLDRLYGGPGVGGTSAQQVANEAQQRAAQLRPFLTQFPPGGNPIQYMEYAQALGSELGQFDGLLNEISGLAGVVPQYANLDGRFENGLFMRTPTDPGEFGSYLQAQLKGGALEGNTTVREADMIPGTRIAQVADPTQWHAAVARAYAYQFAGEAFEYNSPAAQRGTYDPLSAQGLAQAAQNFDKLAPDARVFSQVASVFKGNLFNGPGTYDNANLKNLLLQKYQATGDAQLLQLANEANVGQTDVQTIGAITNALSSGKVTLAEVFQYGVPPQQRDRYNQIIGYVTDGSFNQDLGRFDANPIRDNNGNPIPGSVVPQYGGGTNPYQSTLDQYKQNPVVQGFYAMFDLNGDGAVQGPETAAAVSNLGDLVNLMMSGAQPGPNAPAAVRNFFFAHDFDRDGRFSVVEVRQALNDLSPVLQAIKLDQFSNGANQGVQTTLVPPPGINPNGDIAKCPVVGQLQTAQTNGVAATSGRQA